jgi:RNA polymerase sigma-70 factor (ECF subfamily)
MTATLAYPQASQLFNRLTPAVASEYEEEADLIARIRAGNEQACTTLVRRYGGALLTCARRFLGCEADSADAVQDAFVSAFRSLGTFAGHARLGTWLHRILVNHCLMKLRQRKRRRTVSIEGLLPTFDETGHHTRPVTPWTQSPEEQLSRAETRDQVRACIDRLPEPYREIILLRDLEGLDTEQTAQLLGLSRVAVKTRLHRARQALRTLLEEVFMDEQT